MWSSYKLGERVNSKVGDKLNTSRTCERSCFYSEVTRTQAFLVQTVTSVNWERIKAAITE